MRHIALAILIPAMFFGGFLATPALFRYVNLEYQLLLKESLPTINTLIEEQSRTDSDIARLNESIKQIEADIASYSRRRE